MQNKIVALSDDTQVDSETLFQANLATLACAILCQCPQRDSFDISSFCWAKHESMSMAESIVATAKMRSVLFGRADVVSYMMINEQVVAYNTR
jgi:hypothetical protein